MVINLLDNKPRPKPIPFIVISEGVGLIEKGQRLIRNPFVGRQMKLPGLIKFSVTLGVFILNETFDSLSLIVKSPSGEIIDGVDLKEMYFSDEDEFETDVEKGEFGIILGEVSVNNTNGMNINEAGMYGIEVEYNNEIVAETFFYIEEVGGEQ